jgi:uncharacterized protein
MDDRVSVELVHCGDDALLEFLFRCDSDGRGVPQNYEQALFWYREAADQGYAYAQDEVGSMYAEGQGVPQNYEQAYIWFDLAASREGEATLPAKNRDDVAAKMTPAQIADARA